MGRLPLSRLRPQRRKSLEDIKLSHAWWKLFFYRWRGLLLLIALSVQVVEMVIAAIEGRRPELLLPQPLIEHASARSP